jgi:type II secretory pathway pseudopilin PulG
MTTAHKATMSVALALTLAVTLVSATGCKSAQEKANEAAVQQAKQQAAATGNAQQVVATDNDGNTITTVVQPPAPGQTTQTITVTKTKTTTNAPNGTPQPAVSPVNPGQTPAPQSAGIGSTPGGVNPPVITPVDVHVTAGTTLTIRINQHINVKHAHAGDRFTGEVVEPVLVGNSVAIPQGTHVEGVIDEAHRRGHFKGSSILELRLISMELGGQRYDLDTHDNVRSKKGKGKRSSAFIGGGSGLGMLVGGVATGGVGLVVGGLVGGGVGTAVGGLTGNRDIDIPAESIVHFKLADDLVVQPQQ